MLDQNIYYGTFEGKELAVSHNKRFLHTSIIAATQEQRYQALHNQVTQDLERLTSGHPSATILITESIDQQNLLRDLASKHTVPLYIVDGSNLTDPYDPALREIYASGGVIIANFQVPAFAKKEFYEQFFTETKDFIFNREVDHAIPIFIIVDQSIRYLFKEKKKKYEEEEIRKPNGLEFILVRGRSRSVGVTLLLDSEIVIPAIIINNTDNVFRIDGAINP